jgi:hypothetical protein
MVGIKKRGELDGWSPNRPHPLLPSTAASHHSHAEVELECWSTPAADPFLPSTQAASAARPLPPVDPTSSPQAPAPISCGCKLQAATLT